jgi:hypothetical protein
MLIDGAIAVAGAIGGTLIAKQIPISEDFKPAIPVAGGIALAMYGRKIPYARQLATGMLVVGTYGLLKKMLPNLPLLTGEDVVYIPQSGEEQALLGSNVADFGAEPELMGAAMATGADVM